jgi:hypothetical protein
LAFRAARVELTRRRESAVTALAATGQQSSSVRFCRQPDRRAG